MGYFLNKMIQFVTVELLSEMIAVPFGRYGLLYQAVLDWRIDFERGNYEDGS